ARAARCAAHRFRARVRVTSQRAAGVPVALFFFTTLSTCSCSEASMLLGGGQKATGRPTQSAPAIVRLAVLLVVLLVVLEGGGRMLASGAFEGPTGRFVTPWLTAALHAYLPLRSWVLEHRAISGALALVGVVLFLLAYRA